MTFWQRLKKGILQVFTASVVNKAVSMLSNMVLTRILAQNAYGIFSYVLNVHSYANLIMGFGLVAGALQFGAENRNKPAQEQFYRYCVGAGMLANVLIVLVFVGFSFTGKMPFEQAGYYVRIYMPLILLEYLRTLFLVILRSNSCFGMYSKLTTVHTVSTAVCTCGGAVWGVNGVIFGKYAAELVVLLIILYVMRGTLRSVLRAGRLNGAQKKELWHYSIFNGISSTLNQILYLIDISMIAAFIASEETLAVYKVSTLIPNALAFVPSSVVVCIIPDIVAHSKNLPWLKTTMRKTFAGMFAVNICISLVLIVFAPWIIRIVSGERYLAAVAPFRVLAAGYCIAGTFRVLSVNFLAALKAVRWNVVCSLLMCTADIGLNYLLIPKHGMMGAAYATFGGEVIASLLTFGCLWFVLHKRQNTLNS